NPKSQENDADKHVFLQIQLGNISGDLRQTAGIWVFNRGLIRLAGRPGTIAALERFIDHAQGHSDIWFCRRIDIARHWRERHPP
ncbi:MAG: hypothetical protein VB959_13465, partial [Rhodospirillales bacterium]